MSGREGCLPAANGISARQPVPARDGMWVENGTPQNHPSRLGRNVIGTALFGAG
ncbi:MAG: hypothetical protein LBJ01_08845 [Tannerella sp.]|nr:hypothetical protein [Tannerella sp.]